ncbi:hypothetical protein BD769DRAFT_1360080 [Suillus cothurnatus]|nr:hypothetical protein BD769DRAFT_1360080 [Suillus cothurnatus]
MSHLTTVLRALHDNQVSIVDLIEMILKRPEPQFERIHQEMTKDIKTICTNLYNDPSSHKDMLNWATSARMDGVESDDDDDDDDEEEGECNLKRQKKSQRRAAERRVFLLNIRAVVCMSILLQNTNAQCNYLQGILGVFFHSTCVPQKVINVLNHAGLSISQTSINHAVKSMSREIVSRIRSAVGSLKASFAYDNFDINFKTHQPTIEHHSIFTSATSATSIPLFGVEDPNDLRCSAELWACNPRNPSLTETPWIVSDDDLFQLHMDDTYSKKGASNTPSPRVYAWAWHVCNILVNHGPKHFAKFARELGRPDTVFQIPVHKTHQIPCRSMKIKQSTTDGNVEVVENLLKQGGIGDPAADEEFNLEHDVDMSEHVIVIHGDLLTKERLDIACESRCIEDTPKNRLQFIIFLPGLFHYKMACADALWRTHIQPKDGRDDEDGVRNNASHCVIWRFSLGNTWHELAAPLWVLSASIPI